MSEPRTDSFNRKRSDSVHPERPRPAPRTDTNIPIPGASEDVLGGPPEPTDDSPTMISKNVPKAHPLPEGNLRGRRLAHFELLEQIGAGGMAAVLRARDTQLDRIVALKILPPDMATDAENVQRFHQEARSAAKLDHENIARVFFCGEDQRLHFIAFEYVEGENLRTILDHRGRLPVSEALPYILQIAAGLAHAAERGVVHRDIKPSNIIITPSGRAKLVDMGLARSLGPQKDIGLTHSGVTLGTFDYISPEQALEPRDADVRSDIYSLGCTFYHMMTGRAPVPEGTAAKKLHHHQLVAPPDPRELVHGLPDEVALILDRMMAKNPRQRYQSAEELVQHLLTAAKHLRVGADVPEGVLFVETPLPRTSGGRPYLLVGLAVAAVVALLWYIDQPTATTPTSRNPTAKDDEHKPDEKDRKPEKLITKDDDKKVRPGPAESSPSLTFTYKDGNIAELFELLDKNKNPRHFELLLADNLDLEIKPKNESGLRELLIVAEKITVKPAKEFVGRPTIRLTYSGGDAPKERAALRLRAKETLVEGVQFIIDARGSDAALIGLALEGENHEVRSCDFVQRQPSIKKEEIRLTSLLVSAGKAGTSGPHVDLYENTFLGFKNDQPQKSSEVGGRDAITCRGPLHLFAQDCAFGPHQNTFRLEGSKETLELEHCSVMAADQSAVFHLLPPARAHLKVRHSLFSRPGGLGTSPEMGDAADAVLVRLDAEDRDNCTFDGTDNRFHNLTLLGLPGEKEPVVVLSEFLRLLGGQDQRSLLFTGISPWEKPQAILTPGDDLLLRTFSPKRDMAELRQSDSKLPRLIGVEKLAGAKLTDDLPELTSELIVDPAREDSAKGVYSTLESAVGKAKPGDTTIVIHHDGELTVEAVIRLDKPNVNLTIRAAPRMRPILTLKSADRDTTLFRLLDGRLHLEDLEIRLRPPLPQPGKPAYFSQAVVALMGEGHCSFKNCVVTLDQNNQTDTKLALATLPDNGGVMKMMDMKAEPATPRIEGLKPKLGFKDCLVRGTGDLVRNQSGRPFDLSANGLLVALSGSFCNVEVAANVTPTAQASVLNLARTTTFLGGQLLHVQSKELMDVEKLPAHQVIAEDCLFLPAQSRQTLVQFETKDNDDVDKLNEKLGKRFSWEKGKTNAFGEFEPFLKHLQIGDSTAESVLEVKEREWKIKWIDVSDQCTFHVTIVELTTPLINLVPSQLRLSKPLEKIGADPAMLPKR